jgi:phosphatidylglycerophosphate synthase
LKKQNNKSIPGLQLALCIVGESSARLWGMSPSERLYKQFSKLGSTSIISVDEAAASNGQLIFVRGDTVIDTPLIPVLASGNEMILTLEENDGGRPVAVCTTGSAAHKVAALFAGELGLNELAMPVSAPSQMGAAYWRELRKNEIPYVAEVSNHDNHALEWRMFKGTYKGATDFVTKHAWPRPAFYVTRAIAPTAITPNMVTLLSFFLVVAAYYLFANGYYGWGVCAGWLMTFLDTVDGKLARTTLTSTQWGGRFDHGIDLFHPPFWYYAWGLGLVGSGFNWTDEFLWTIMTIILLGYVVQRLLELAGKSLLGYHIHIWRPIDTLFREYTARRNPNLFLLMIFAIVGRPDLGLIAVVGWILICLILHMVQIIQVLMAKRAGQSLKSWMN